MADHISGTGPDLLAAAIASTLVALASLTLRNFVRLKVVKCPDGADYAVNAAMVFALAGMATSIVAARTGLEPRSAHDAGADADRWAHTLLAAALTQIFWVLAVTVGKLAVCLTCLSLVKGLPLYSWGVRCLVGFTVVINGTTLIAQLVACPPVARPWDSRASGSCIAALYEGAGWVQAIGAAASDLPLAVFPLVLLRKVKMMARTRVALSGIMCLGLASTACAMIKCIIGHRSLYDRLFWQTSVSPLLAPPRFSAFLYLPSLFTPARFPARSLTRVAHHSLEQNIGITALNISALCPLASRTCRRLAEARILHMTDFEDALFLESLSNMKGRTKGPAGAHRAHVTAAKGAHDCQTCRDGGPGWSWWPRRDRAHDDTSSQRGLVDCPSIGSAGETLRILKTVSVSVRVKNDVGDRAEMGGQ